MPRYATPTDVSHLRNPELIAAVAEIQRQSQAQDQTMRHHSAPEIKPELPRPLMRELPPADPFPIDALGEVLAPAARAIHDRVQAPLAICGQSVLGATTLTVQPYANVVLPIGAIEGKRVKPLSCLFITVAETGERKTECDYNATWAIRKHEQNLRDAYDAAAFSYSNDKLAWDKAREGLVKQHKGNRAAIKAALEKLGPAPLPPLAPMLTSTEPTFEGLCKQFPTHSGSLGIFASEGGQFVGGHAMSDDAKLRTAAGLSSLWDGDPVRRVRAGEGAAIYSGRRLAMHLMIQPDVANILFQDPLLLGQGLLSRVLPSAPESTSGTRSPRPEQPMTTAVLKSFGARLLKILETPQPTARGKLNELEPRELPLSDDAIALWFDFVRHVEGSICRGGSLEPIRGLANKLPEHAARLAAVITLVSNFSAGEIDVGALRCGVTLAEHYATEALRIFEGSKIDPHLLLAQRLLNWLHQRPEDVISLPDIYQRSLNAIGDQATARALVATLADHGWLVPIEGGAVVAGQRRREVWRIVRV